MDAYDRWMQWLNEQFEGLFPPLEREAITALPPRKRFDRDAVNRAVERAYQARNRD